MAEGLFRDLARDLEDVETDSAGVSAIDGYPPSEEAVIVLQEMGIDISGQRSAAVTVDAIEAATHIVAMTEGHKATLEALFPEVTEKTFLMTEFSEIPEMAGKDIPDPIGLGNAAYLLTRDLLEASMHGFLEFIHQTSTEESMTNPDETTTLRIAIAADHGGVDLKSSLVAHLESAGHSVENLGTDNEESVDYTDYAGKVTAAVAAGEKDLGILVCKSGIGMSIAANRNPQIRAALVINEDAARVSRQHNNANVLCLGACHTDADEAAKTVDAWLGAEFEGGRHQRRIDKLDGLAAPCGLNPDLAATDRAISAAIVAEENRQTENIELIASENFASTAVREAQGSVLTNKYAEGYPGKRWYGGCEHVDTVETLAIERALKIFGADHANVQPHSGSQANAAVYFSVLKPGDTILTMDLAHGGHLTHGHRANFSGKFYEVVHYGVSEKDERIDYDGLATLAKEVNPKMITAGASAYPRVIDFARMREIADSVDAYLFVDMAHIAGLVAAGVHPSPVPHAQFVTTTTHKSLRGPRGGLILCPEEFAKKIDSTVFPGVQGGPLMHVIAAKAVCFHEALQPGFKEYQEQIVANSKCLADCLAKHGYRIISGGTDNHLMLVDLRPKDLNGKIAQETLDEAGITVNKNAIPFDTLSPMKAGGIRIGTPAVTTRGMGIEEMETISDLIFGALSEHENKTTLGKIREKVRELTARFPLP